jgi:hypothetical protein
MALTNNLTYGPLRLLSSASVTGSYQILGAPLEFSASIIKVVNDSSQLVTLSLDGITDNEVVPANSFFLYDITAAAPSGLSGTFLQKGTQLYVKGTAGTGTIYLVYMYVSPQNAVQSVVA